MYPAYNSNENPLKEKRKNSDASSFQEYSS